MPEHKQDLIDLGNLIEVRSLADVALLRAKKGICFPSLSDGYTKTIGDTLFYSDGSKLHLPPTDHGEPYATPARMRCDNG